jgi:hypothetical protein
MKTNNLKFNHSVNNNKVNAEVKIRLNDECKNGHQDFSITATFWEVGKSRNDKNMMYGGCCHDEVLKHFPQFKQFIKLHLSDCCGVPMYAVENGFYHMREGFNDKTKDHKTEFCKYYRITPLQYDELKKAKSAAYYGFILVQLGVLNQWKHEADEAIKVLEELTENEFLNDSVKSQITLTDEDLQAIQKQVNEGFYTDEAIEEREVKKAIDKKAELLQNLKNSFEAKNLERLQDYEIDKIGINLFLSTSNIIFYKHKNTIVFNWSDSSYDKKYTESEFKQFLDVAKQNKYLKDCIFELK